MQRQILLLLLLSFFLCRCSEDEPQQQETFPAETDVAGFWKLNKVYLDDVAVSFDNRELNLENEYFRISGDKSSQRVVQLNTYAYADNYSWSLDKDLLQIGGIHGFTFKIQSFSTSQLVISPNAQQNLELEYNAISGADFPETSFTAIVSGEAVSNTGARAKMLEQKIELIGGTESFSMFIYVPIDAATGQQFSKIGDNNGFSALVIRNAVDYGTLLAGTVRVIERTNEYVHVEFEFTVGENGGTDEISVANGTLRAITMN